MKLNHKDLSSAVRRSSSPNYHLSFAAESSSSSDRAERSSSPITNMASSPPSSPPSQEPDEKKPKKANNKADALDNLLASCAQFSDVLIKKSEVLGRLGHGIDGQALGEHSLKLAEQPKCMIGGTMRDYQLEGLTWMYEIAIQGMSGILADEMGLGKTIQTISLLAKLRDEDFIGAHLIVAPLSTLSNWQDEFEKWTPKIPIVKYHGDAKVRKVLFQTQLLKNLKGGNATHKFPVVLTTPEIVLRDSKDLGTIGWEMIIIVSQLTIQTRFYSTNGVVRTKAID
jgi:ATP-dependent DNA helicase